VITTTELGISLVGWSSVHTVLLRHPPAASRRSGLVSMVPITILVFLLSFGRIDPLGERVGFPCRPSRICRRSTCRGSSSWLVGAGDQAAACYIGNAESGARRPDLLGLPRYGTFIVAVPLMLVAVRRSDVGSRYRDPLTAFLAHMRVFGNDRWVSGPSASTLAPVHGPACDHGLRQVAHRFPGTERPHAKPHDRLGVPHVAMTFNLICSLCRLLRIAAGDLHLFGGGVPAVRGVGAHRVLHASAGAQNWCVVRMPGFLRWLALPLSVFLGSGFTAATTLPTSWWRKANAIVLLGLAILSCMRRCILPSIFEKSGRV
jgi:hypothetical protein